MEGSSFPFPAPERSGTGSCDYVYNPILTRGPKIAHCFDFVRTTFFKFVGTARTKAWRRCQGAPAFSSSTAACTGRAETPRRLRWGPRDCQPARSLRAGGAVDGCWHTMRTPWAHRAKAPTDIETEPPLVYRHRCRARCCSRSALISRAGWLSSVRQCMQPRLPPVCSRAARIRELWLCSSPHARCPGRSPGRNILEREALPEGGSILEKWSANGSTSSKQ